MNRQFLTTAFISLLFCVMLAGCTMPGWQGNAEQVIEETEPVEEQPELDISGIFVGSWLEWSEDRDQATGYSYIFYNDGVILVSREDHPGTVLQGEYEFVGNNTFSIAWSLPGSGINFEPVMWQIQQIRNNEVNFLINGERPFTLKRELEEKPPLAPPPPSEPPAPPQTPSAEIQPNHQ